MRHMKIIWGRDSGVLAAHAKAVQKACEARDHKPDAREVKPKGVAAHLAKFPVLCDDCGETFWANDQWANHTGCRGVKRGTGF